MSKSITRKINFLGRVKINEHEVVLQTYVGERYVGVEVAHLTLPENDKRVKETPEWSRADVILRARDKSSDNYFEVNLGTVLEVRAKKNSIFRDEMPGFTDIENIKFSIRVIGPRKNVLASIDDFKADNDTPIDRDEIFQLRVQDLEEESWLIDWTSGAPVLVMDTDYAEHFMNSAFTHALILPAAFREILSKAAQATHEDGDGAEEWVNQFIEFAQIQMNAGAFPYDEDPDSSGVRDWVDAAVRKFALSYRLKSTLIELQTGKEG